MKCLYCGKELAILKRLSGSEFCSDGHRKLYQQEYNQLALNRLISNAKAVESMASRPDTPALVIPSAAANAAESAKAKTNAVGSKGVPKVATNGAAHAPAPPAHEAHSNSNGAALKPSADQHVTRPEKAAEPPQTPPPPKENLPPFAEFVDSKPPARQGLGFSPCTAELEPVAAKFPPVHPANHPANPLTDLEPAQSIPFAAIVARPGAIEIDNRSEPRDFAVSVPRMERVSLLTLPVLQHLQQPFPISAHPCTAAPASLWTASAKRWEQIPELVKESIVTSELEAADFDFRALADLDQKTVPEQESNRPSSSVLAEAETVASPQQSTDAASKAVTSVVIDARSLFNRAPSSAAESIPAGEPEGAARKATDTAPAAEKAAPPAKKEKEPALVQTFFTVSQHIATASPARPISLLYVPVAKPQKGLLPDFPVFPIRPAMAVNPAGKTPAETKASPERNEGNQEAKVTTPQEPSRPAGKPADSTAPKAVVVAAAQAANRIAVKPAGNPAQKIAAQQSPNAPASKSQSQQKKAGSQKNQANTLTSSTPPSSAPKPESSRPGTPPAKTRIEKPDAGAVASAPSNDAPLPPFPTKANEPPLASVDLRLPELHIAVSKPINRSTLYVAAGVAAALVLAIVAFIAFPVTGSSSKTAAAPAAIRTGMGTGPDWIEDFAPDAAHPRTISVLRSTTSYKDYRIEMEAQIDRKALGWVFRAKDSRNFQVAKIELQPLGSNLNPVFVHYAVVNGAAEPRKQVPLGISVGPSTVFRLRFEASGNKFTAYVQDRKVDEWADPRFPTGGAGLYSDKGERALLQSAFDVTPVATKAN